MIFVEYDKTTKEVVQTTKRKPASPLTANTKIICVNTDTTVWHEEELGGGEEALLLPTTQTMPSSLEPLKTMALEHAHHVFQEANQEFVSGGSTYVCDQETKIYIIGLVSSAQVAIGAGDTTWTTTRINTEGVAKTFTATEFIAHAQDMEADMNTAYQLYLQRKITINSSTDITGIYAIIDPM